MPRSRPVGCPGVPRRADDPYLNLGETRVVGRNIWKAHEGRHTSETREIETGNGCKERIAHPRFVTLPARHPSRGSRAKFRAGDWAGTCAHGCEALRRRAVAAGGASAAETLHVGDHPLFDVHGARDAGLRTAWVNRNGGEWPGEYAVPDLEVCHVGELAARIL